MAYIVFIAGTFFSMVGAYIALRTGVALETTFSMFVYSGIVVSLASIATDLYAKRNAGTRAAAAPKMKTQSA